jgi:type IV secretory pathway TraG/TraD family ATPase VirD4
MLWISDAMGVSRTILLSLNRTWVDQQGNFFVESAISFFAAIIWFLHEYKGGVYCTLPHAIELARLPYSELFPLLTREPSIATAIEPFLQTYENGTMEQLDGQMAGMRIPLGRLSSPDIYYILPGNDLRLHLNDPQAPKILCLGGNANRMEAITPVLSLYIDRINRLCNQPKQYPCALVCDEFATVRAASILNTMATGRGNDIIPIIAVQDISQLRTLYTQAETDWITNVNTNVLCGQLGGEAARRVSERFPKILRERASISVNSSDTSVSRHPEWEATVSPATVANLSAGEFLGVLSDDPQQKMAVKAFHAQIVRSGKDDVEGTELPVVREVSFKELQEAYDRVKLDIEGMVGEVQRGMMGH